MAFGIDKPGVAGVVPAVCPQHLGRSLRVFVIAFEQAGRPHQNFAVIGHPQFHAPTRHAHCVSAGLVVGLQADKNRRFGRTVQLLEVHANGAVKAEQIRAYCLARRVGHPYPAHAQAVAQGAVHQDVTQRVQQAVPGAHRRTIHARGADAARQIHEEGEHPALEGAGIFHADHYVGEQTLKHPRWCKVVGRADFFQVDGGGGRRLRAIHHVAAHQPLRVAENVLPDPGHRQIRQHFFSTGQVVKLGTGLRAVEQAVMGMDHSLRVTGGAGGEEHGRHIIRPHTGGRFFQKAWLRLQHPGTFGDQVVD